MIGAGFWKRKFGASPDIIGRQITLDGIAYTIVGVIPAEFHFTNHGERVNADIYTPIGQWDNPDFHDRKIALGIVAIGRLKPGVTLEQAQSDMNGITENLARAYPEADKGTGVGLYPLREEMTGGIQPVLLLLFGAVGFVLLIACVNIANLLLARSAGRAREFAIRAALGAGRGRIIRQLLTESILLAVVGGALGLLIAAWGLQTALHTLPATLPRVDDVSLDSHVLIFTIVVTLLAGVLFGLAPALKTSAKFAGNSKGKRPGGERRAPAHARHLRNGRNGPRSDSANRRRTDDSLLYPAVGHESWLRFAQRAHV